MAQNLNPLGFSTGFFWQTELAEEQKIERILEIQDEAIELGIGRMRHVGREISDRAIQMLQKFAYQTSRDKNAPLWQARRAFR